MKKPLKKSITLASTVLLAFNLFSTALSAVEYIPTRINGKNADLGARLINGTTYVEVEPTSNELQKSTKLTQSIKAAAENPYISSCGRYIGGNENLLIDNKIFVPIRSVAKLYGASVNWVESDHSVDIVASENDGITKGDSYYNADDVYWLSRIINAEACGEPMRGKILVGNVVLNRVKSSEFPDTIYGVIFDKKYGVQFSPVSNGTIFNTPDAESIIAAKICLDNYYISREALYFLNPRISRSLWIPQNRPFIMSVGEHDFYS